MIQRPPSTTRSDTLFPYTTRCRSHSQKSCARPAQTREYNVEFWTIGNRFQAGHRLRLYLLGAATYSIPAPNLNLVSVGGDTPSRLLLPVLPGSDACAAFGAHCEGAAQIGRASCRERVCQYV